MNAQNQCPPASGGLLMGSPQGTLLFLLFLLLLTSVLGYELKTAVGTSVFIMAFTAFTGSVSHFAIGGAPNMWYLLLCVLSTLLWARIAAKFANKASAIILNRATGVVLTILGAAILAVNYL